MIYLDWAATAPPDSAALEKHNETAQECYGNPSSPHPLGLEAEGLLNTCRESIAACLGCNTNEVYFTSGGTESNNIVLASVLGGKSRRRERRANLIISGIEHASVFAPACSLDGWDITVKTVKATAAGIVDPSLVERALDEDTRLVSVMHVNNETGAIQPVADIAAVIRSFCRKTGWRIRFHTDGVQAFGKVPFSPRHLGVDAASLSAHKLGGLRGVGALYISGDWPLEPLYRGGGQEGGVRPGTENLPGIAGFALVARNRVDLLDPAYREISGLMDKLTAELSRLEGVKIIPADRIENRKADYSPYILKISVPPIPGEVLVRAMGERGICVSTGSACSSRQRGANRVLENMGVTRQDALSSIRISIGPSTTENDLDRLLETLKREVPPLLRISR